MLSGEMQTALSLKQERQGWEYLRVTFSLLSFKLNIMSKTVNIMYHCYSTNEAVPVYNKNIW